MTCREIEKYKKELRDILKNRSEPRANKHAKLMNLAIEVGASTRNDQASDSELADNINDALRTEAMILATKTASKHYKITIIAAIAAVIGALAAWAAVLFNFYFECRS